MKELEIEPLLLLLFFFLLEKAPQVESMIVSF